MMIYVFLCTSVLWTKGSERVEVKGILVLLSAALSVQ